MAQLRLETYHEFCWPESFKNSFRHNVFFTTLTTLLCLTVIFGALLMLRDKEIFFSSHVGAGAFYSVIPYSVLVSIALLLALGVLVIFAGELKMFRRGTGGNHKDFLDLRAHAVAASDVLRLKYLAGGGHGCNYPDERFSMLRRWLHHLVFYGFALCLGATAAAACYEHFLQRQPPYAVFSLPVILGAIGGIAMLLGTSGLLYLKSRMDQAPAAGKSTVMDIGFLGLLFMVNLTGLILLILRETSAMGTLLALHLGFVASLFLTAPYGKFVHAVFRYAALVQNAAEQKRNG
jgi:citrate/tricarballylate utilization protein